MVEIGTRNRGFAKMFAKDRLTVGVVFPIEGYGGAIPTMENPVELTRRAEAMGYTALWFRDVPLHGPNFGGRPVYDTWVYIDYIAAHIGEGRARDGENNRNATPPLALAKAAAMVDRLSGVRLVVGVSSSDCQSEYPAFGRNLDERRGRRPVQGEAVPGQG